MRMRGTVPEKDKKIYGKSQVAGGQELNEGGGEVENFERRRQGNNFKQAPTKDRKKKKKNQF